MSSGKKAVRERFREAVFKRDRHACRICGVPAAQAPLDAHHITPRESMPFGGYVAENGIALCPSCHVQAEACLKGTSNAPEYMPAALYADRNQSCRGTCCGRGVTLMRMLTLHRPWAWCVVFGGKLVENRPMKPPPAVLGQYMAIHAGRVWSLADEVKIASLGIGLPPEHEHPSGVIIGVCRVIGYATHVDEVVRRMGEDQRRWFFGPYGWLLDDMRPLVTPVKARGFQGVPHVPAEILPDVRAQVGLAA